MDESRTGRQIVRAGTPALQRFETGFVAGLYRVESPLPLPGGCMIPTEFHGVFVRGGAVERRNMGIAYIEVLAFLDLVGR